ncbi:TIGR04372 family glycosyltransferase [Polynucleobacter sp. UB-Tiil-W10]|uniref:TIGR04372 family glycosyltransferase n=1 Tax=Polynucleobacter sp. UB-Tiil-W10 TaxID=1855648 RepID=UPI001C0B729C|nr:TIGR04372 family glycosyltransferase [Polynucleobacter sp. UB-Tiil-W10]MBU3540833.1 TIGR04372 family glycosyltransferase [Polynucleobacter sp. UB-Tiil-W10]
MKSFNRQQLTFEYSRLRQMPWITLARKAAAKLLGLGIGLMLLPSTALLHLAGYRYVTVFTDRIGHLALEPDCLLKMQALGQLKKRKWIMLAPAKRVANAHLLLYWQPFFYIVQNPTLVFLIRSMSQWGLMHYDLDHAIRAIGKAQSAYSTYADWGMRAPLLKISKEDQQWSRQQLAELGLPEGAWFACVHARGPGFSPVDESLHGHRNSLIENFTPAIQEIVNRGGWVIRIGDTSMNRLAPMPQVVDYAHHRLKSARLDIVLCAEARFILGNTSGIALVGTVFGTPCALTNMVPLAAVGVSPMDISIPKLYWSLAEQRYLTFSEIFSSKLSQSQYSSEFTQSGIRLEENSPEEIRELAIEMMADIDKTQPDSDSVAGLSAVFLSMLGSHHYSFGTSSRLSQTFLERHQMLLKKH